MQILLKGVSVSIYLKSEQEEESTLSTALSFHKTIYLPTEHSEDEQCTTARTSLLKHQETSTVSASFL
jgi:hypothetical protein